MGYYLFDNPPASLQYYPSRREGLSGGVVIHTTEGVGGDESAENTAGFISRRADAGSYHAIVDTNSTVMLLPDEAVAFGVAASGFNSRCWMIAIAARSGDLSADSPETQSEINRMGEEICAFWRRNDIDPVAASRFIGEEVKNQPGLAHHGDVQPWDRSDAWSRRGDRELFDQMLIEAIGRAAGTEIPFPMPRIENPPAVQVYQIGSTGPKVEEIQRLVGVASDGVYGPVTAAAVSVWQKNLGIASDGIWGPITEEATANLFAFLSNLPAQTSNPFLDAVNDARTQVLRVGSTGGATKMVQMVLVALGWNIATDGVFGPQTESAVREFQSNRGLQVDGIVGPATWEALVA